MKATERRNSEKLAWSRYSLRMLLLAVFVCSLGFGWLAYARNQSQQQWALLQNIERVGGSYTPFLKDLPVPSWLKRFLGIEMPARVKWVVFEDSKVTDQDLAQLAGQPFENLDELDIDGTQITDAGLLHVKRFSKLRGLHADNTKITDAGLAHLSGMPSLIILNIENTQVSGKGIACLADLPELRLLNLNKTPITDSDLSYLKGIKNLKHLSLENTRITDAGVIHLLQLKQLETLRISGTQISENGILELRNSNPNLNVITAENTRAVPK